MYYYFGEQNIIEQSNPMDRTCNNNVELSEAQITFFLANRTASKSEVQACQMNPVVVPEPVIFEPSIEERVSNAEDIINLIIAGDL